GRNLPNREEAREQYIGSRYPDVRMLDYDKDDAEDCLRCMEMVMNYV
ncbi:MAG: HEPN domain-containing protein, partial [Vulcanisaeta sp.]